MSKVTDAEQDPEGLDSLRDVFHNEIAQNGGDSAKAFIATLDELDARIGVNDDLIRENRDAFGTLVQWVKAINDRIGKIPTQVDETTGRGTERVKAAAELAANKGAREGAAPSNDALEALWEAIASYQARKWQITRLAMLGLPLAFSAALFAAFLFASFVIPALPQDWQWPCKVLGAEFRKNANPERATTFCVIVRE